MQRKPLNIHLDYQSYLTSLMNKRSHISSGYIQSMSKHNEYSTQWLKDSQFQLHKVRCRSHHFLSRVENNEQPLFVRHFKASKHPLNQQMLIWFIYRRVAVVGVVSFFPTVEPKLISKCHKSANKALWTPLGVFVAFAGF